MYAKISTTIGDNRVETEINGAHITIRQNGKIVWTRNNDNDMWYDREHQTIMHCVHLLEDLLLKTADDSQNRRS
jgi:hypothetical protein